MATTLFPPVKAVRVKLDCSQGAPRSFSGPAPGLGLPCLAPQALRAGCPRQAGPAGAATTRHRS
eukprot:scaffold430765_cov19-Prasinocladus_malaysianus.AAC.1